MHRILDLALIAASLSGCALLRGAEPETRGPFADPRRLCEQVAGAAGLRILQPWESRAPGRFDCVSASPALGEAPGPMKSYVALHANGPDPRSADRIALQANVLASADEELALGKLEDLIGRTFEHLGLELPGELAEAVRDRLAWRTRGSDLAIDWQGTEIGGGGVSWTLYLQGSDSS
ncbi:MAG: hypothetical protein J4G09_02420 [Proteobacteria bacterium]|nr:hypothetical protein [Pseudomonadota bacterium]